MRVYLSPTKPKTTIIEHIENGVKNELEFSNNTLAKTAFVVAVNDENPIFRHLNKYLDMLSDERQGEIFSIIAEIQSQIESPDSWEMVNKNLRVLFGHLFQRIRFNEILEMVLHNEEFMSDITLPSLDNIKSTYENTNDNYTKEKTYIFSEYQELIAMIIQLRIMFAMWAYYIEIFSGQLGTNYKEFEAFKLIEDSDLFKNVAMQKLARYVFVNTPEEGSKAAIIQLRIMFPIWAYYIEIFSGQLGTNYKEFEAFKLIEDSDLFKNAAMQKLTRYVFVNTPEEGSKAAIIDFVSSEDYPLYNLALVVVRKIITMDIRNPGERNPILIMHIATHVREKILNNDKKQGAIIEGKTGQDGNSSSEERQISMMERFKIRERLTVGQKVFLKESVSNPMNLARMLKPDVDLDLVSAILAETLHMGSVPVERVQKIILKNMIQRVAPYRVVDLMTKSMLVNSLGVIAAIMIEDGFPELAQFCTATTVPFDGTATIATDQHQNKVTSDLKERVVALMPFQKSNRSKIAVSPIAENIDLIFKELTSKVWHNNLPDHLLGTNLGAANRRIKIPGNLRIRLTEWAIHLVQSSAETPDIEDMLSNLKY